MKPQEKIKPAQVKLLNVAIKQLGLDKEDLKARYQVESTKDLTNAQFDELMEHLCKCGFKYAPKNAGGRGKPKYGSRGRPAYGKTAKAEHLQAIGKALEELDLPWAYAEGIAKRMGHAARLEWCRPEELHKVQVALNYKVRKQAGDPVQHKPETLARRKAGTHGHDNTL
ncbi:MAG: phage protein GemA/Gp16 family protein [Candidatus Cloacimonadaceae bacterium]|jgi:phage gp16-like protein